MRAHARCRHIEEDDAMLAAISLHKLYTGEQLGFANASKDTQRFGALGRILV